MNATPISAAPNAIDLKDRATRAMRLIGVRHPHFLIAWRKVRDLVRVDPSVKTFAVDDRGVIYIGPKFGASLSPAHFGGVLVHELMHLALDHAGRARALGLVSPEGKVIDRHGCDVWNVAGDWCINERLRKDGIDLPKCAIYPPAAYPSDRPRTSEAFYYWIREQEAEGNDPTGKGGKGEPQQGDQDQDSDPSQGAGDPQGDPDVGAGCGPKPTDHAPGSSQGEAEGLSEAEVRQIAREIRASARQLGIGTGSSACLDALEPSEARMPWERLLRSGFDSANARRGLDRPTYSRRSRRAMPGTIVPGWISTDPKIAIMIDVSGSMDRKWVARIVAETEKLCDLYQARAFLVTHTSDVTWEGWISRGSKASVAEAVKFSGGTRATPAYEAVSKADAFDVAIHFTDCEIENPWPESPARRLIVAAFGLGAEGEPYSDPPEGAELIPVMEGGIDP